MKGLLLVFVLAVTGCFPAQTGQGPYYSVVPGHILSQAPRTPTEFRMWRFHAPVVPVSTSNKARMLVPPPDPSVLGWWGRPAGARHGTTLIVGHSVHTGGGELDTLKRTPLGSVAVVSGVHYRVVKVMVVSKKRLATLAPYLFRQTGSPQLAVVSCANYNWSLHVWPDNAIVIAKPIRG